MRQFFSLLVMSLLLSAVASAQNIHSVVIGPYQNANGEIVVADPTTTIVVDLTIEKQQTIVGPYARYAQKYLDTRGSLVDKTVYNIVDANLSLMKDDMVYTSTVVAEPQSVVESHMNTQDGFAKVLPDRLSMSPMTVEDAAAQAAQSIFSIRKKRMELITGDAGENVFGGGLKDALEALADQEQALLELFLGKNITSTNTVRLFVPVTGAEQTTIAKLANNAGLQAPNAANGTDVKLTIKASGVAPKLNSIAEADPRDKTAIMVRLADNATCSVSVGDKVIDSTILPIFELGRTVYIANTIVKR